MPYFINFNNDIFWLDENDVKNWKKSDWSEITLDEARKILLEVNKKIPTSVTMRQARLALLNAGLLDNVTQAISNITDPIQKQAAQIEWEYAQTVDRNSAFTQQLANGLGLTDAQLDELFMQASAL